MTAGNTELVFVAFFDGQLNNPQVSSITDTQGDTYTKLGRIAPVDTLCNTTGSGSATACPFVEVWYTLSIASTNGTGTITVTTTPTGAGTGPAILFQQYSGVAAVNTSNVTLGSAGSGATSATLSITATYLNDFVVGAFADNPVNTLSVNGCTARGTAVNNGAATINAKSCDASGTAGQNVSVGMTFSSAAWAGAAVELCTTSPCPAVGVSNHIVLIN